MKLFLLPALLLAASGCRDKCCDPASSTVPAGFIKHPEKRLIKDLKPMQHTCVRANVSKEGHVWLNQLDGLMDDGWLECGGSTAVATLCPDGFHVKVSGSVAEDKLSYYSGYGDEWYRADGRFVMAVAVTK
jgi:hypothetical protein